MRQSHSLTGRIAVATLVLAGVIAGTAVVTSELASAADAARRAPRSTHIGIAPDDFVVLDLVDFGTENERFVRINSDATRDTTEFSVPEGRVFVLTGYDAAGEFVTYQNTVVRYWIRNPATGDRHTVVADQVIEESDGQCGVRGALTEGVVFGEGTVVQVDAVSAGNLNVYANTFRALNATSRGYEIHARGYLVDAD